MLLKDRIKHYIKKNTKLKDILLSFGSCIFSIKKSIRGTGNKIYNQKSIIRNSVLKIKGNNNYVEIEQGTQLQNVNIEIYGNNCHLIIKKGCTIANTTFYFEDDNGRISVGESTTVVGADFSCAEGGGILLGTDCMLSYGIDFRNTDSHSILDISSRKRINPSEDIVIGNHVWIGANVTILKGVNIFDDVIIGVGSVVTANVNEKHCIIAGIPARIVKRDVTWDRKRI